MAAGDVVYATTFAYNYGPIWFLLLGVLRELRLMTACLGTTRPNRSLRSAKPTPPCVP